MIVGYARVSTDGQTLDAQHAALALGPGDILLVTRLDRLGRSTRDLLNVLDAAAKAGAGFRSLADAWADTTTAHGRLMLTVLGGLAEFERESSARGPMKTATVRKREAFGSGASKS
jgi:DNA invertase Pin-like site-specific DNA recombinase